MLKLEISPGSCSKEELLYTSEYLLKLAGYKPTPVAKDVTATVEAPPVVAEAPPVDANPFAQQAQVTQAPGIEVDSVGLPWDHRIHSGSRAKTASGEWRKKRGVADDEVFEVEKQLADTMMVPATVAVVPAPPAPTAVVPVPPPFVPNAEVPAAPVVITPPLTIAPVGAVTTASPSSAPTFPQLMSKITQAFAAKTLDQPTIMAACQAAGVANLPMLASRPDLVGTVASTLGIAL